MNALSAWWSKTTYVNVKNAILQVVLIVLANMLKSRIVHLDNTNAVNVIKQAYSENPIKFFLIFSWTWDFTAQKNVLKFIHTENFSLIRPEVFAEPDISDLMISPRRKIPFKSRKPLFRLHLSNYSKWWWINNLLKSLVGTQTQDLQLESYISCKRIQRHYTQLISWTKPPKLWGWKTKLPSHTTSSV